MSKLKNFLDEVWRIRAKHKKKNPTWDGKGIVFVNYEYLVSLKDDIYGESYAYDHEFHHGGTVFGMKIFASVSSGFNDEAPPPFEVCFK